MIYYKYVDYLNENDIGTTYVEVDNKYVVRQIYKSPDRFVSSNRKDIKYDYFLAEGEFYIDDMDVDVVKIEKIEFENIWEEMSGNYREEWLKLKETHKISERVTGVIDVFYPQGPIVRIDENTFAIIYDEDGGNCNLAYNWSEEITGIIAGYDDINMWLILKTID